MKGKSKYMNNEIIGFLIQRDFFGLSLSYTNPRPDLLHFSHSEFSSVPLLPHAPHILIRLHSLVLLPQLAYPLYSNAWFVLTQPLDFITIVISLKKSCLISQTACVPAIATNSSPT